LGTLKQTPVATEPETNDTHTVIKPERIASILNEMRQQLVLIGVRVDAEGPLYNSLLVRLDEATQQLYLDELNPFDAQESLAVGDIVHIYASLRGIAIRFVMTVDNIFIEDGHMLYVGAYPTHISYLQRRDIFRVPLPLHERRSVTLQHERSELELTARLIDLSIKGFCIGVLNGTLNSRCLQTHFRYLNMDLPELRAPLSGQATLVNLRPSIHPGITAAGFSIIHSDPQTERALMRAALYYQREARKKAD